MVAHILVARNILLWATLLVAQARHAARPLLCLPACMLGGSPLSIDEESGSEGKDHHRDDRNSNDSRKSAARVLGFA